MVWLERPKIVKLISTILKKKIKQPSEYTLGTGHVYFFYNKLKFITDRYYLLNEEALKRGFKVNPIVKEDLIHGIQQWWFGDYTPTEDALVINRARIKERLYG